MPYGSRACALSNPIFSPYPGSAQRNPAVESDEEVGPWSHQALLQRSPEPSFDTVVVTSDAEITPSQHTAPRMAHFGVPAAQHVPTRPTVPPLQLARLVADGADDGPVVVAPYGDDDSQSESAPESVGSSAVSSNGGHQREVDAADYLDRPGYVDEGSGWLPSSRGAAYEQAAYYDQAAYNQAAYHDQAAYNQAAYPDQAAYNQAAYDDHHTDASQAASAINDHASATCSHPPHINDAPHNNQSHSIHNDTPFQPSPPATDPTSPGSPLESPPHSPPTHPHYQGHPLAACLSTAASPQPWSLQPLGGTPTLLHNPRAPTQHHHHQHCDVGTEDGIVETIAGGVAVPLVHAQCSGVESWASALDTLRESIQRLSECPSLNNSPRALTHRWVLVLFDFLGITWSVFFVFFFFLCVLCVGLASVARSTMRACVPIVCQPQCRQCPDLGCDSYCVHGCLSDRVKDLVPLYPAIPTMYSFIFIACTAMPHRSMQGASSFGTAAMVTARSVGWLSARSGGEVMLAGSAAMHAATMLGAVPAWGCLIVSHGQHPCDLYVFVVGVSFCTFRNPCVYSDVFESNYSFFMMHTVFCPTAPVPAPGPTSFAGELLDRSWVAACSDMDKLKQAVLALQSLQLGAAVAAATSTVCVWSLLSLLLLSFSLLCTGISTPMSPMPHCICYCCLHKLCPRHLPNFHTFPHQFPLLFAGPCTVTNWRGALPPHPPRA